MLAERSSVFKHEEVHLGVATIKIRGKPRLESGSSFDYANDECRRKRSIDLLPQVNEAIMESIVNRNETISIKKPRPNHQRRLRILRAMSPRERLEQLFRLNERALKLFRIGLRRRFPDLDDVEFHEVYLQMRARCHNRNY
jgi:hypothetical protein